MLQRCGLGLLLAAACRLGAAGAPPALTNPFFAMDTGTRDATHRTPAEQVALVKELGFAGVGPIYHGADDLQQWYAALDQQGLKLFALYLNLNMDEGVTPQLKEAVTALKGHDTFVWLYVTTKKFKPSATDGDESAVKALRELADFAAASGVKVALYPHTNQYAQRVEDCVRLIEKVGRKNLGVTFNLCHWLKVDGKDLAATLKSAAPHLFVVTVSGADAGGTDWKKLIQPLDTGTFDVLPLLQQLQALKFAGPIGLQHFGIRGSVAENLKHSMDGWKKLQARLAAEKN
jgi:sugar phosphate isomerase/epimerase